METFISGAMVIEGALLSFLLALSMTWLGLHGLFRLMPVTRSCCTTQLRPNGINNLARLCNTL